MVMNITCKYEEASYNVFFFVRTVAVKSTCYGGRVTK